MGGSDRGTVTEGSHDSSRHLERVRDTDLLARVRARDLRAFEALYRSYQPRLTRFLTILVKRPRLVEEVLNDTMLVVWERSDGFRGESALSTWIFAIAYRKGLQALKKNNAPIDDFDMADLASTDAGPEEMLGVWQKRKQVAVALNKLSADHRAVVDLTYFHELSYREIAVIMACPVDTVKTRMFHARRHLKTMLPGEKTDWL